MRAAYIVLPALACLILAYRYYSAFLAAKVMVLDDRRVTPAHTQSDGHNFHPTSRWVLFGHHFAAIAGPGPAHRARARGAVRLPARAALARRRRLPRRRRARLIILWASTRRKGASLAEIARMEIGPVAGFTAAIAILFIIVIALAGVGVAFVNALAESPWGVFTIAVDDPARAVHEPVHVQAPARDDRRGDGHRRHRPARSPSSSAAGSRRPRWAPYFTLIAHQLVDRARHLRLRSRRCCRCGCCSRRATTSARS